MRTFYFYYCSRGR